MVSKVRNVRLGVFSGGGCHHPNIIVLKLYCIVSVCRQCCIILIYASLNADFLGFIQNLV